MCSIPKGSSCSIWFCSSYCKNLIIPRRIRNWLCISAIPCSTSEKILCSISQSLYLLYKSIHYRIIHWSIRHIGNMYLIRMCNSIIVYFLQSSDDIVTCEVSWHTWPLCIVRKKGKSWSDSSSPIVVVQNTDSICCYGVSMLAFSISYSSFFYIICTF